MLKPFYQGKLDVFCAIYAVLNALRLTHSIRTTKARDILNETLLKLAINPAEFSRFLNQQTDYINVVDNLLAEIQNKMPLDVSSPFSSNSPSCAGLWAAFQEWLGPQTEKSRNRAIVFRFLRHIQPGKPALNRHWTTADFVNDDILHLFDCSHEAEAILNIRRDSFVVDPKKVTTEKLLYIQPDSVRFLRLPF